MSHPEPKSNEAPTPPVKVSQRFHADDSDIIFQSSDGVRFHLHEKYLKISTKGFNLSLDVIPLKEAATTLELLFQFCYPERHPDLENIEFDDLLPLAEAAEKYQVFSAMNVCKIRMRDTLPSHALDILVYAANHNYPDITGAAAPLVVFERDMSDILPRMPPELVIPWVIYHEKWWKIARAATSYHNTWEKTMHEFTEFKRYHRAIECQRCEFELVELRRYIINLLTRFGSNLTFVNDLDTIFARSTLCEHIAPSFSSWRTSIEENIKNLPRFGRPCAASTPDDITEPKVLNIFNAKDSDITIQSSDGILFPVHKLNLTLSSTGFPPSECQALDEIVHLTETSSTFNLLLKFCYPDPHPDIETLEFEDLSALSEAAEKYGIYSVMNICAIRMKKLLPQHAEGILVHAAKHGYSGILDIASPLMLKKPLSDVMVLLPAHQTLPWVRYYEQWLRVWKDALSDAFDRWDVGRIPCCASCNEKNIGPYVKAFLHKLGNGVACLVDLNALTALDSRCCDRMQENFALWRKSVEASIIANIRSFATFL